MSIYRLLTILVAAVITILPGCSREEPQKIDLTRTETIVHEKTGRPARSGLLSAA